LYELCNFNSSGQRFKLRYFIEIVYHGGVYHGLQIQRNAITVQQVLNEALRKVVGDKIRTICGSRTDTGVHAEQNFLHFDTEKELNSKAVYKLNRILPGDIAITSIFVVNDQHHVRFDAIERHYTYRICRSKNPFLQGLRYFYDKPLAIEKMNEACQIFYTLKDYQSFSRVKTDVDDFECTINFAEWTTDNEEIVFSVRANRFLRGMVRTIVGTMLEIGLQKMGHDELLEILESKDRRNAGRAVPAEGLFLTKVIYPENYLTNPLV